MTVKTSKVRQQFEYKHLDLQIPAVRIGCKNPASALEATERHHFYLPGALKTSCCRESEGAGEWHGK